MQPPILLEIELLLIIFFKQTEHIRLLEEHCSHNTDILFNTVDWHLIQILFVYKKDNLLQLEHSIIYYDFINNKT